MVRVFYTNRFADRHVGDGLLFPSSDNTKELSIMTKTLDLIVDSIRNAKHPFPQVVNRPAKPQKSRYERRKVREYIRLGDWRSEEAQA